VEVAIEHRRLRVLQHASRLRCSMMIVKDWSSRRFGCTAAMCGSGHSACSWFSAQLKSSSLMRLRCYLRAGGYTGDSIQLLSRALCTISPQLCTLQRAALVGGGALAQGDSGREAEVKVKGRETVNRGRRQTFDGIRAPTKPAIMDNRHCTKQGSQRKTLTML
jgi:hypothetical protein